jgi:hypothetical protein
MIHPACRSSIRKAGRKSLQQFQSPIRFSQQQSAGIISLLAAIE